MIASSASKYFYLLIKVLVIVCFVDGLIDFSYYMYRTAVAGRVSGHLTRHLPSGSDPEKIRSLVDSFNRLENHYVAGIGLLPHPTVLPGISIGAYGQRMPSGKTVNVIDHVGILLGASQSFGFGNDDDHTLSSALNRLLPRTNVLNFAISGQRITDNVIYLQSLMDQGMKFDFALMVNGAVDITYHCIRGPEEYQRRLQASNYYPSMVAVFKSVQTRVTPTQKTCGDDRNGFESVVNRVIHDLKGVRMFADEKNVPLLVVIPPTPYGNRANVSNLADAHYFRAWKPILDPVFSTLSRRLKENPLPGVIDLSDAFDGGEPYFIDASGHMTGQGQEVLARAIVKHVDQSFFSGNRPGPNEGRQTGRAASSGI